MCASTRSLARFDRRLLPTTEVAAAHDGKQIVVAEDEKAEE
ncbi:hypothetical protein [Bradyrhizobium zhanjiangense]|nr:hypothetical protein [Bradyrhizobium zhanjiangense]